MNSLWTAIASWGQRSRRLVRRSPWAPGAGSLWLLAVLITTWNGAMNTRSRVLRTGAWVTRDRKSTRLNSSHVAISYAVFCLKKKNKLKGTNAARTTDDNASDLVKK